MRYFKTSNASRRYVAGELAFTFEPVSNIGGNWLGVLAVEVDSTASIIAAANLPQIQEITAEQFEELKKKPQPNQHFRALPGARPSNQPPPAVGHVVQAGSTSTAKPAPEPAPVNTQLKTAVLDVPDELKLETGTPKPRKR